jgi:trehalose/maltose hydrolase-like predicted phosphorylase
MVEKLSWYFAKVLNAPNWIGIDIEINGELGLKYLYSR